MFLMSFRCETSADALNFNFCFGSGMLVNEFTCTGFLLALSFAETSKSTS
jgi:hypothetical protein